jgi:hypothetical protein
LLKEAFAEKDGPFSELPDNDNPKVPVVPFNFESEKDGEIDNETPYPV